MFFYVFAIFLISIVFSLGVLLFRLTPASKLHSHNMSMLRIDGLTDGIFLGIGLFEFLPHAAEAAEALQIPMYGVYTCVYMSLAVRFAYKYYHRIYAKKTSCVAVCCPSDFVDSQGILWSALLMLGVHSVFEGMALGIVEEKIFQTLLFGSIFMHKGLESMAFANAVYNATKKTAHLLVAVIVFALLTPFGVCLGMSLTNFYSHSQELIFVVNIFSATMFLHMGLQCMLNSNDNIQHMFSSTLGLFIVAGVMNFLGHHH